MANFRKFLETLVNASEEYRWNGISPDRVAIILIEITEGGDQFLVRQQALLCNQYPIKQRRANKYCDRFQEPTWKYVGHVFSYTHPAGGTHFQMQPDPEFGDEKWEKMLNAPIWGTGITHWETIMCHMTEMSYEEYLALKKRAEQSDEASGRHAAT